MLEFTITSSVVHFRLHVWKNGRWYSPRVSQSDRNFLALFLTLPIDSVGTGSMWSAILAGGEAAALADASQCSPSPSRSSRESSWRNRSRSCSHSSGQNCRTCCWPALSKLCLTRSRLNILSVANSANREMSTRPALNLRGKGDVLPLQLPGNDC